MKQTQLIGVHNCVKSGENRFTRDSTIIINVYFTFHFLIIIISLTRSLFKTQDV